MHLFLTSSPCSNAVPDGAAFPFILNEENGFVEQMKTYWKQDSRCLIISADPDSYERNDEMAEAFHAAFSFHELTVSDMKICDSRNASSASALVADSDMLIFAGGHVPTQNAFFQRIGLGELVKDYPGIIMGISAGTMNCAEIVYAQPELEGESVDPEYQRFIPGVGLTKVMVLPHYQQVKDNMLDGKRLYEDITYSDSMGQRFYVLVDGSYILAEEDRTVLYGEGYLIQDGTIAQICEAGGQIRIL